MKQKKVHKFLKYISVGLIQTPLDLFLLWFFTDFFGILYLISAIMSTLISSFVGFTLNKRFAFKKSKVKFAQGYSVFATITFFRILALMGLLYFFVDVLGLYYLFARILSGLIMVAFTYTLHTKLTFKTDFDE